MPPGLAHLLYFLGYMYMYPLPPCYCRVRGQRKPNGCSERQHPPFISKIRTFFQKSGSMVEILKQFHVQPWRPIFDSRQNKKISPVQILSQIGRYRQIICIGLSNTTWLHTVFIQTWQFPITLSQI